MRKGGWIILLAALCLSGCADIVATLNPPFVPNPIIIFNPMAYADDKTLCSDAGKNYQPVFSFGDVATSTFDGATSNTSLIPISPYVPLAGAAGAALKSTTDGLDVMSGQHAIVYRNCLFDAVHRDGAAILVNTRN